MANYFNGFSLKEEDKLFDSLITKDDYTVVGFSYGAQKAFEKVYHAKQRVNRLILLSPAFFQTEKKSFIRTQLRYFESSQDAYVEQFLKNVAFPSSHSLNDYLKVGTKEELEALLTYVWDKEKIESVLNRGVTIEVFFGEQDKIINVKEAIDFFNHTCITYTLKSSGHLLLENK